VIAITIQSDLDHRSSSQWDVQLIEECDSDRTPQKAHLFKDIEHLVRLAVVMLIVVAAFVILRAAIVPRSFGEYGHYRGAAIAEIAAKPIVHAGHQTCETCHSDIADVKKQGKHVGVNCEACHGALAAHADDPVSVTPAKLDTAILCARCHEANSAKPKWFPQVVTADHSGGLACDTCHQPHSPKIEADKKETAAGGKQ
jgi:transcription elongation factor Elf1